MPELTSNIKLKKPLDHETADIKVLNENMDKIDKEITDLQNEMLNNSKLETNNKTHTGAINELKKDQEKLGSQTDDKVSKVEGKGLSTNDFTNEEKIKLSKVQEGATKYIHPATHPASMITGLHSVATSGDYNSLKNKPSSLPASGGNADTVDGKHFEWLWGNGSPTHIWGSNNDSTIQKVFNPNQIKVGGAFNADNVGGYTAGQLLAVGNNIIQPMIPGIAQARLYGYNKWHTVLDIKGKGIISYIAYRNQDTSGGIIRIKIDNYTEKTFDTPSIEINPNTKNYIELSTQLYFRNSCKIQFYTSTDNGTGGCLIFYSLV